MFGGERIIRCYDFLFGLLGKILLFIGMFFIVCRKGLFCLSEYSFSSGVMHHSFYQKNIFLFMKNIPFPFIRA